MSNAVLFDFNRKIHFFQNKEFVFLTALNVKTTDLTRCDVMKSRKTLQVCVEACYPCLQDEDTHVCLEISLRRMVRLLHLQSFNYETNGTGGCWEHLFPPSLLCPANLCNHQIYKFISFSSVMELCDRDRHF